MWYFALTAIKAFRNLVVIVIIENIANKAETAKGFAESSILHDIVVQRSDFVAQIKSVSDDLTGAELLFDPSLKVVGNDKKIKVKLYSKLSLFSIEILMVAKEICNCFCLFHFHLLWMN